MKDVQIIYTSKGFEQDADQAMEGDVVRGLIELITNADDAYGAAIGKIRVSLRRTSSQDEPVEVSVSDAAKGLTTEEMEKAFLTLGGNTSGFLAGDDVRGLFGRGSKDTAWFGQSVFESVKDGIYTILTLNRDGKGTIDNRSAESSDYSRLHIPSGKNGLTATIRVFPNLARVPDTQKLFQRISSHFQLRDINCRHEVLFEELMDGKRVQTSPVIWEDPEGEVVINQDIEIPEYGASIHFEIKKLAKHHEGSVNDYSAHGIEVVGRRAAYMNTFFSLTGYGTGLLHGRISAPIVDDLIRNFDKDEAAQEISEANPIRLVRRDRKGLSEEHPFMRLLSARILEVLKPIVESLQPKAENAGGAQLRKDLNQAIRAINDLMKQDLGESDDDETVGPGRLFDAGPIIVIPPLIRGRVSSMRDITVLIDASSEAASGLNLSLTNPNCEIVSEPTVPIEHGTFSGVLVSRARVHLKSLGSTSAIFRALDNPDLAGSGEVIVHDDPTPVDEPPTCLEWKNTSMSVAVGKTRSLLLRAPVELGPSGSVTCVVELEGESAELIDVSVDLRLTKRGWLEGRVKVRGVQAGSNKIMGYAEGQEAAGRLKVGLPSAHEGFNFEVTLEHSSQGSVRGFIRESDTGRELVILTQHPGLASYIGQRRDDGSYTREQEPETKATLVEVMASVAADFVLRRDVAIDPTMYRDIDMIVQKRNQLVARYLRPLILSLNV